jgi:hypothetical protein
MYPVHRCFVAALFLIGATIFGSAARGEVTQVPRPNADALAKADENVREIYKADLARAKRPKEQTALADEFLKTANGVGKDDAARFVLLTMARDLAVQGKDLRLAMEAVNGIVERFVPDGPTDAAEQIKRGNAIWEKAGEASDVQRRGLQVEAAEWYVRAKPTAEELAAKLIEKRLTEVVSMVPADDSGSKEKAQAGPQLARAKDAPRRDVPKNDLKALLGTWNVKNGDGYKCQWTFNADGNILSTAGSPNGKWSIDSRRVIIRWDNSHAWDSIDRPIDPNGVTGDSWRAPGIIRAWKTAN